MEQLQIVPDNSAFSGPANFEHAQRVAKMLSASDLVPKNFQGNVQNTLIALELSNRIGASPLMVMQNLYIVHGKPSFSSTFIVAAINSCGKFSPLRYEVTGSGDTLSCKAWAYDKESKDRLEGPTVTMAMAKAEGWIDKAGSKWKTMPELMIRYRSAAFFGRLYAPEIMMGMQTQEEVSDAVILNDKVDKEQERITLMLSDCQTIEDVEKLQEQMPDIDIKLFNARKEELNK